MVTAAEQQVYEARFVRWLRNRFERDDQQDKPVAIRLRKGVEAYAAAHCDVRRPTQEEKQATAVPVAQQMADCREMIRKCLS